MFLRECERTNDDEPPKKLPKLDFADDSYSSNENILRFFAAFGVPFQAVFFWISNWTTSARDIFLFLTAPVIL
ncbi:hypothetical protein L596_001058 [Steinernema carpocapsae]|uniref:Uncharacterized protein n=1 Tax=Steinernema carpocapsae TaxID=34508 RepID=A0A4U8UL64_STECR|nr:hypothetical protein L596_001058 [Steinernema carpocapsae]